jgi:prepilin-type N-terminal cleavage/methylation domain-containing protein
MHTAAGDQRHHEHEDQSRHAGDYGRARTERSMKARRGFTLVELMVVVAILALLMGAAAQMMRPNRAERCKSAARSLLGAVHEARQSAITLHQASRLKLSATSPYTVAVETRSSSGWVPLSGTFALPNAQLQPRRRR